MLKRYWFPLILLAVLALVIHSQFWQLSVDELKQEDIYFIWLEGKRIALGENPYARILDGNLRINDKYPTYFPVTYFAIALFHKLGFTEFKDWLIVWRPLTWLFHVGLVFVIFRAFQRRGAWLLGAVAVGILVFGRWSLYIVRVHHIEFAAIFFLIYSLVILRKQTRLSLFMYSLSLGIKHIAVFLLPLYLIYVWIETNRGDRLKKVGLGLLLILSVPLLTSLPFIILNADSFFKSIVFSATRQGAIHIGGAPSIDLLVAEVFPWFVGLKAKSMMLLLMGLTYLSFWRERVHIFIASTVTMMIFLYFNSVLFLQYFIWPLSLLLLAFSEFVGSNIADDNARINEARLPEPAETLR
jgi:hypothetical protein